MFAMLIISKTHTIGARSSVKKRKKANTCDRTWSSSITMPQIIFHMSIRDSTNTFIPA